jgi:hypothetical protein
MAAASSHPRPTKCNRFSVRVCGASIPEKVGTPWGTKLLISGRTPSSDAPAPPARRPAVGFSAEPENNISGRLATPLGTPSPTRPGID